MNTLVYTALAVLAVAVYHLWMSADYPRIGLYAGFGVGVVFGTTVPVEPAAGERLNRALRTSIAFAATTGLGYALYQNTIIGVSWGVGGLLGCIAGILVGQVARDIYEGQGRHGPQ